MLVQRTSKKSVCDSLTTYGFDESLLTLIYVCSVCGAC